MTALMYPPANQAMGKPYSWSEDPLNHYPANCDIAFNLRHRTWMRDGSNEP